MAKHRKKNKHTKQRRRTWAPSRVMLGIGVLALVGLAAVAMITWTGGDGEASPRRALNPDPVVTDEREVTVKVVDNDYEARDLTVPVGAEVTFEFKGKLPHTVTDEKGGFDSGTLGKGDSYVLTFEEAGTYYYYCTLHHAMQGKITAR